MRRDEVIWRVATLGLVLAVGTWLLSQSGPDRVSGDDRPQGWSPDPEGTKRFLQELPQPMFSDAGAECLARDQKRDVFLYRAAQQVHRELYGSEWVVVRQGIGDCVSHGWAHGCWISMCVDYETGRISEPPPMVCSESVYGGSRVEARGRSSGGWGDGSYGGAAAKFVRDWGCTFRLTYPQADGGHVLLEYSSSLAKSWGNFGNGGDGDGGVFDGVAKRHPMKHVALVKTFDEAAAAIASGYPVPVCSGYGFSSQRDDQGFARRQGSWAHCMCFIAVRHDRPGLLCLNSWGPKWNGGPKWPDDMPDGSFWVDADTATGMLSGGDSCAVGGVDGFRWRDLHHGDWLSLPPLAE
jgi:hypothetical protein